MMIKRILKKRKICECGCGKLVSKGRRFIQYHPNRGKLGKKLSQETKDKIGKSNKKYAAAARKRIKKWRFNPEYIKKSLAIRKKKQIIKEEMKLSQRKLCKCGCGGLANYGRGIINGHFRKYQLLTYPISKETRRRQSLSHKGKPNPNKGKKGIWEGWSKGLTKETDSRVRQISETRKARGINPWKNSEYVAKQMKSRGVKPNKLEKYFEKFLNSLYPNEWKYVGDGQLIIGGKCPDFVNINGQKKIIELFGDFWHKGQNPEDRKRVFEPFGYKTLVVWEGELKERNLLEFRIHKFMRQ